MGINNKIGFSESIKFFRLLDLQRKLRAFDYNTLELENLEPLRKEVDDRLRQFHEKNKAKTF